MSYQHERAEFISLGTREGLSLDTCRKLLRYATTLQRLAEAQCNGDWPYNGDRDRPVINEFAGSIVREKWDARYTTCPKCEASGVAKRAMHYSFNMPKVSWRGRNMRQLICPDCRTQELVQALLAGEIHKVQTDTMAVTGFYADQFKPIFQGDPRGAVLLLATPSYPWSDDGSKGRGLYVPARVRQ